eukprot:TRINITY_DN103749_c0_g1_i1.p1 TRINITY_DN103749_c0_g1~~TRINITY_DN103749_c0_g1_i1.p1  ORF type:complete len:204 (+),score=-13.00 TRINITY_DN103749_c0_g1_i1:60-614(+)
MAEMGGRLSDKIQYKLSEFCGILIALTTGYVVLLFTFRQTSISVKQVTFAINLIIDEVPFMNFIGFQGLCYILLFVLKTKYCKYSVNVTACKPRKLTSQVAFCTCYARYNRKQYHQLVIFYKFCQFDFMILQWQKIMKNAKESETKLQKKHLNFPAEYNIQLCGIGTKGQLTLQWCFIVKYAIL